MIEFIGWFAVAFGAVASVIAAAYAFTRRDKRDRHTWIDELFGPEES